ncbi:Uma2 family endonuclease [Nostoc sp. CHAB 5715]|uniref:Uma2 family endonuclease n=1 Tax=Nostoc sp. CHAB 5715 TaxID=2780400 RepID=UPI001E2A14AF|nr:Uma2 family endonuclease [Nostoc sp. CHAB 5715]MCC5623206.1 Uma2 family endonuclease [Nostoc sp. CHAB 5715]
MTITQESESTEDISQDVIFPPGDLYSDEPPWETELHMRQIILLLECLKWLWRDRNDFYATANLTIYYNTQQLKSRHLSSPDFFVVLKTERKIRKSWVVWEEYGKYPHVVVEIMSESTAQTDKGIKKEIYQDTFRTPDYFWFDPYTLEFAGFHLVDGKYQPLQANAQGHLWSKQLGLYLGIHQGLLRWFTPDGQLVLTLEETIVQAQETIVKAQAKERVERLAAKLRELNIDPDTI